MAAAPARDPAPEAGARTPGAAGTGGAPETRPAADVAAEEAEAVPVLDGREAAGWPDETAEAAFWGEARERGETRPAAPEEGGEAEESRTEPLPALEALVERIPAEVRSALDDLFRARFVRVTRVPRKALKAPRQPPGSA